MSAASAIGSSGVITMRPTDNGKRGSLALELWQCAGTACCRATLCMRCKRARFLNLPEHLGWHRLALRPEEPSKRDRTHRRHGTKAETKARSAQGKDAVCPRDRTKGMIMMQGTSRIKHLCLSSMPSRPSSHSRSRIKAPSSGCIQQGSRPKCP